MATLNFALGNMNDNQGNYCFIALGPQLRVSGNLSALEMFLKCGEQETELPAVVTVVFLLLMTLSARFIKSVYQTE